MPITFTTMALRWESRVSADYSDYLMLVVNHTYFESEAL